MVNVIEVPYYFRKHIRPKWSNPPYPTFTAVTKEVRTYANISGFLRLGGMELEARGGEALFGPGQYVTKCTGSIVIRIILDVKHL